MAAVSRIVFLEETLKGLQAAEIKERVHNLKPVIDRSSQRLLVLLMIKKAAPQKTSQSKVEFHLIYFQ